MTKSLKTFSGRESVFLGIAWALAVLLIADRIHKFIPIPYHVFTTAPIEEPLKYLPLFFFQFAIIPYGLSVASVVGIVEFSAAELLFLSANPTFLFLRIIPHFLFFAGFLRGSRRSLMLGVVVAILLHFVWNFVLTT